MGRNIARLYLPVEGAVREEMQQLTAGNVVLCVHQVEVAMQRVDDDAVRHTYLADLRGIGETGANDLMATHVDDAVGDGVRHRHL